MWQTNTDIAGDDVAVGNMIMVENMYWYFNINVFSFLWNFGVANSILTHDSKIFIWAIVVTFEIVYENQFLHLHGLFGQRDSHEDYKWQLA